MSLTHSCFFINRIVESWTIRALNVTRGGGEIGSCLDYGCHREGKVQFFIIFQRGKGGGAEVISMFKKKFCIFYIIQRALWQHKLRHRKDHPDRRASCK